VPLPPAPRSSGDGRRVPQLGRSFTDLGMRRLQTTKHEDFEDAQDEVVLRIEVAGDRSVRVGCHAPSHHFSVLVLL
jgi:hypothetical protein